MQRVLGRFYSDWQVATKRILCFLTLDRKPRLRSQSYIGPTIVGPDLSLIWWLLNLFYFISHNFNCLDWFGLYIWLFSPCGVNIGFASVV